MPPKGSSHDPRYLGTDERGYAKFQAECGHIVWGRDAKRCLRCYARERAASNYVGVIDGKQMYKAACGHLARRKEAQRCRECAKRGALREGPYHKNYYPVVYHKGSKGRQQRVHVAIAEATLGRQLRPGEVVHHINMDKFDNRRCNLLICTREYHRYLHHAMELKVAARIRAWQDSQGA